MPRRATRSRSNEIAYVSREAANNFPLVLERLRAAVVHSLLHSTPRFAGESTPWESVHVYAHLYADTGPSLRDLICMVKMQRAGKRERERGGRFGQVYE